MDDSKTLQLLNPSDLPFTKKFNTLNCFLGSIEVTIANMEKRERSKSENVFVTSFVPEHHLTNKQPTALDPYLNPLIDELVELFINGD